MAAVVFLEPSILPIRKHNFATEPPVSPSFATRASGAAVAWEAYLCQKFRMETVSGAARH